MRLVVSGAKICLDTASSNSYGLLWSDAAKNISITSMKYYLSFGIL